MNEQQPLDLHAEYADLFACGYDFKLTLHPHRVVNLVARLRGIDRISAILKTESEDGALKLGEWMRSGLVDAIHMLAHDSLVDFEKENERERKASKEAE
jgi:hypothetical protein